MGHVNNAVYLTYIESARVAFLFELGAASRLEDMSVIIARVEVDFRAPMGLGDDVAISVVPGGFGDKSFGLDYVLRVRGETVAEGKDVCVAYDYNRGETVPIPDAWRECLAA